MTGDKSGDERLKRHEWLIEEVDRAQTLLSYRNTAGHSMNYFHTAVLTHANGPVFVIVILYAVRYAIRLQINSIHSHTDKDIKHS